MEGRLHTIGEVAELTGVPVRTIRYYSDIGLLPPAEVSDSRYRLYAEEEIWRLELIRTLRRLDFGIKDVRGVLSGKVTAATAIAWQREALASRVRHLERVGAILEQAEANAEDPERSLEHLHDLGEALAIEAEERSRFLAEKLRVAIVGDEAPEDWREEFLRSVSFRIPEELSPEQAAAWVELVTLIKDPDFIAEHRQHTVHFWEALGERGIELAWWHDQMTEIGNRARTAVGSEAAPESDEVQEIVDDWLALFARVMEESPTPEFARRFAGMVPRWIESVGEKSWRFWELLARLDVEDLISSQDRVNELLIAGLRWRVAQEAAEGA
jgi:DNA-binding transcriptional MerR regulator